MSLKNDKYSFIEQSFTTSENRYYNLNLNQSKKCPILIPFQSNSKSNNDKSCVSDNYEEKRKLQSWNKPSKASTFTTLNEENNDFKKLWKNENTLKTTNKSTLSLHIAAHENSTEAAAFDLFGNGNIERLKKEKFGSIKTSKQCFTDTFTFRNPFEFPRQLNEGTMESEVGQFLSSQRLLNPNKSPRISRQIGNNDEQMVQCQMPPSAGTAASDLQMVHPELHNDNQRAVSTVPQEAAANENDVAAEPICYFAEERKNILETISRTNETKVPSKCHGNLISFGDLMSRDTRGVTEAEIILARGAAEFSIKLDNEDVKREIYSRYICYGHRNNLSLSWNSGKNKHVMRRWDYATVCSFPTGHGVKHKDVKSRTGKIRKSVNMEEAHIFLTETGQHIFYGTPVCDPDKEYLQSLVEKHKIPVTGDIERGHDDRVISENDIFEHEFDPVSVPPESDRIRNAKTRAVDLLKAYYDDSCSNLENDIQQPAEFEAEIDKLIQLLGQHTGLKFVNERKDFDKMKPDTQQRKVKMLQEIMGVFAKRIAPSNPKMLIQKAFGGLKKLPEKSKAESQMEINLAFIREQYYVAQSTQERIIVLSQVAAYVPFADLLRNIPGINEYRYKMARFLARQRTQTFSIVKEKQIRERYNKSHVLEFIKFITSDAVMVALPYGMRTVQYSDGTKLQIANTIRKQSHSMIISMFHEYLKEKGLQDIVKVSPSVLRKILDVCSAHRLTSMHCVDYFEACGKKGFDKIISCLKTLTLNSYIDAEDEKKLRTKFEECRLYLSTDYAIHIKEHSRVAEHCINYSLSDKKNTEFCGISCEELSEEPHSHDMHCDRCELFPKVIQELDKMIEELLITADDTDKEVLNEIKEECEIAEKQISEWKKHILRAVRSESTRKEIISSLNNNEALVTLDYAMKFLPRKHNETQRDFFAKSGLSWHVSAIQARIDGKLVQHSVIHLLGKEEQNANVVAAIIRDNLKRCKELGIKKVTFRMDNAGYYRNAALIQTCFQISKEIGIPIARISFSEMQAGKSVADRVGGQAKARIKEANDAGEDIETAKDMYMGLTFGPKPIPALTVAVVEVFDKFSEGEIKIPGISQISDVEYNYDTSSCVVWRHHGIGSGKIIQLTNTPLKAKLNIIKTTPFKPETQGYVFWREPGSVVKELLKKKSNSSNTQSNVAESNFQEDSDDECADKVIEEPENISFNPFKIFCCPTENCIKKFVKFGNMQNHCETAKHTFVPQRITLYDTALNLFAEKLEQLEDERTEIFGQRSLEDYASNEGNEKEKGWALHETEAKKRFSKKVHIFIEEQMAKYRKQGKKVDAKIVENLMETVTFPPTGKKLFAPSERLNSNQIASLVKRKLEKELKVLNTNSNEDTRQIIREEINDELENETGDISIEFQDHPMFPNDIDLLLDQEFEEDEESQSTETPTRKSNVSKTPENASKKRRSGDSATSERGKRKRKI